MLPSERGRAILGAPPPRGRAGAVVAVGARPGDAVEAPVRRAATPGRVGPQPREPGLHARQTISSRIVSAPKEAHLRHTQELREGDGMRAREPSALINYGSRGDAYQLMLYANFCRQIKYELPDSSYLITWHAPTVTSPLVKVLRFYKANA